MGAHEVSEQRSAVSRVEAVLTWLGGGHWRELTERHERSTHVASGVVVLIGAVLAWLVAATAGHASTRWPLAAVVALSFVFAVLVGTVARGIIAGPRPGRAGTAARVLVAVAVGVVVGELAALVVFAHSIDQRLEVRALHAADSTPAVAQAVGTLRQTQQARDGLDNAVAQARARQDDALVVARCEYHPSPACPQTRITGDPGAGPETRTANELLADAQRELDSALAARERQAPQLDAAIAQQEQAVAAARRGAIADAGPDGVGTRWLAMNDLTLAGAGALALRLLTIAFFITVYLLPLILRTWRGETIHDRNTTARAERERAELEADTAIAIKRAEVRREAEILWAEHQLTQARMAIEAQVEIDREQQRRRVAEAIEAPLPASAQRVAAPADDDIFLPIEAEAEAASRVIVQLPSGTAQVAAPPAVENLPARSEPVGELTSPDDRGSPLIPSLPDATRAAARWIRPLVPPLVARVLDTGTAPLRTARQVFEEVEEITFSLKRSRKVTVHSESSESDERSPAHPTAEEASAREFPAPWVPGRSSVRLSVTDAEGVALGGAERGREVTARDASRELRAPDGPRQLPPGKSPDG